MILSSLSFLSLSHSFPSSFPTWLSFPWPPLVVLQSFLVAVVIPEKKEIQSFAKQQGISGDYSDFLKNDKVPIILLVLMHPLCLQLPSPHS